MDAREVRRSYLEHGGSPAETARAIGVTRSAVYQAIERANERHPLVVPSVTVNVIPGTPQEDREAIAAYVRLMLERAGILREPAPD